MSVFVGEPQAQGVQRVTVDGMDVTERCFGFDTKRGLAYCYRLTPAGDRMMTDEGDLAIEVVAGRVDVEMLP